MAVPGLAAWLALALQVPEPPAEAVRWSAPPGCPDGAAVASQIARRLGRALDPAEARVEARVQTRVEAAGKRFAARVELQIGEQVEVRTLSAASCSPLAEAVALVVAAAVEAGRRARAAAGGSGEAPGELEGEAPGELEGEAPGELEGEAPGEPGSVEAPARPEPTLAAGPAGSPGEVRSGPETAGDELAAPRQARARRRGPGLSVRVEGGPELGALLRPTGAVGLGVGALWRRFRLQVQGVFVVPRTLERTYADVRAGLVAGSLTGCLRTGRGALEVPLCAGIEVGAMRGEARRLSSGTRAAVPWAAALLGAGLTVRVHPRVHLWTALYAVLAPVRPRFELRGPRGAVELLEPSPVSGRLLVGVELRFGDPR